MCELTLALTPSWMSGTRGMASYREETYVMRDFSSGWGTSTSVGEKRKHKPIGVFLLCVLLRLLPLTFWVQQPGDAQLSLCHAEGLLQILLVGLPVHLTHVNESGPAGRNQSRNLLVKCHHWQQAFKSRSGREAGKKKPLRLDFTEVASYTLLT